MKGLLARWVLTILVILLVSNFVTGFEVTIAGAILGSILLGFLNAFIRPILVMLTLPLTIVSLGLFTLVINGVMLWFTSALLEGFTVNGLGTAILAALLISVFSFVFNMFIKD